MTNNHAERYSTSLVIKEMQIRTTILPTPKPNNIKCW